MNTLQKIWASAPKEHKRRLARALDGEGKSTSYACQVFRGGKPVSAQKALIVAKTLRSLGYKVTVEEVIASAKPKNSRQAT